MSREVKNQIGSKSIGEAGKSPNLKVKEVLICEVSESAPAFADKIMRSAVSNTENLLRILEDRESRSKCKAA